jgi:hypothetical protein
MKSLKNQTDVKLQQICNQWDKAVADNNVPEIEKFMSADWVLIGTEGRIKPRQYFIDFIKSGDLVHHKWTLTIPE